LQTQRETIVRQENRLFNQETTLKKLQAIIDDKNRELDRLVKAKNELLDTLKSASKYLATTPAIVTNTRAFEACIEFCQTVMTAKDKLLMTRTKP